MDRLININAYTVLLVILCFRKRTSVSSFNEADGECEQDQENWYGL